MTEPFTISVVIPAYNAEWCIRHAVRSVLDQDHKPYEILVVDDGSQDKTVEILAGYRQDIHIISKENGGLSSARNAGIRKATGSHIAFLDADDWWLPGKLSAQAKLMQENPRLGFCSVATRIEDSDGNLLNVWHCPEWQGSFLETLFHHNPSVAGSGSGVMARKALFEQVGLFDENLKSLEDIDMWMRLAAVSEYACLEQPLAVILKHSDNMSRNRDVMRDAAIKVMEKNLHLLPSHLRGSYWRSGMAGIYTDYAKWAYRAGNRRSAIIDALHALSLSPFYHGRLCIGILRDILFGRSL